MLFRTAYVDGPLRARAFLSECAEGDCGRMSGLLTRSGRPLPRWYPLSGFQTSLRR